jgi:polyisoprenoid-binding protein YceI
MNLDLLARRAPGLTMTGLALAGAVVTMLPGAASAQDTAAFGVLDTEPATIDCSAIETDPAALGAASIYVVDPAQSEARYIAEEELSGVGANTAVGSTQTIQGAFLFDADGNPIPCSTIYVDVRTFESDSSRRDNFLRGNTLQSDQYPLAEFVVTEIQNFTLPADGEETTFTTALPNRWPGKRPPPAMAIPSPARPRPNSIWRTSTSRSRSLDRSSPSRTSFSWRSTSSP